MGIAQRAVSGFLGQFIVKLLKDDESGLWEHQEPFGFRDSTGVEYWAPKGHTTDFCSVPRVPLAYEMLGNRARMSGSIHDYLYGTGVVPREKADELLREMLVLDGVSQCEAEQFYFAVRLFGAAHYSATAQA